MPTVTGTFVTPAGTVIPDVNVQFSLVDEAGVPVLRAWQTAANKTVYLETTVNTDVNGAYSVTLPGNTDLYPSGTRWLRRASIAGGATIEDLLLVPSTGGPYPEDDIVVDRIPPVAAVDQGAKGRIGFWKLGGAENSSISTTSTSHTAIAGLGGTISSSGRPAVIHLVVDWATVSASGKSGIFRVTLDGTALPGRVIRSNIASEVLHVDLWNSISPAAGFHTVGVTWAAGEAGTTLSAYPAGLIGIPCSVYCEVIEW